MSELSRDTDRLEGRITHAEQAKIDKEWARAVRLGFEKMAIIDQKRKRKNE